MNPGWIIAITTVCVLAAQGFALWALYKFIAASGGALAKAALRGKI